MKTSDKRNLLLKIFHSLQLKSMFKIPKKFSSCRRGFEYDNCVPRKWVSALEKKNVVGMAVNWILELASSYGDKGNVDHIFSIA